MKGLLPILLTLLFFGCSTRSNVSFVDTSETIQLRFGMSTKNVIDILGKPLFVKSGDEDKNEVEWAYEVRYKLIKSNQIEIPHTVKKKGSFVDYTTPESTLILVFKDGELIKWYTEKIISGQSDKKVNKEIIPKRILFGVILPLIIGISILEEPSKWINSFPLTYSAEN